MLASYLLPQDIFIRGYYITLCKRSFHIGHLVVLGWDENG
jgi:hypothetical protein